MYGIVVYIGQFDPYLILIKKLRNIRWASHGALSAINM